METKNQYLELLNLFVSDDERRPNIQLPFKQDGRYIATNSNALVYVDASVIDLPIEETEYAPDVSKVIPIDRHIPISYDLHALERFIDTKVLKIDDVIDCNECDGTGYKMCDMGHDHECVYCEGGGVVPKPDSKQIPDPDATIVIGGIGIRVKLFDLLIKAGKIMGVQHAIKIFGEPKKGNLFQINDIKIILMPCLFKLEGDRTDRIYKLNDVSEIDTWLKQGGKNTIAEATNEPEPDKIWN